MDKHDMIMNLDKLPGEIAEAAYEIELINKRVLLQHNLYLENKYREYKAHSSDTFMEHKIKGWQVLMEMED